MAQVMQARRINKLCSPLARRTLCLHILLGRLRRVAAPTHNVAGWVPSHVHVLLAAITHLAKNACVERDCILSLEVLMLVVVVSTGERRATLSLLRSCMAASREDGGLTKSDRRTGVAWVSHQTVR